ncbi:fructose-6-phosphate aldolase [Patescibacteria group bacterium]|nr:fructose-6-phosphate aldolase [Patescibacteria group bacterium]
MKLFLDTANLKEIDEINKWGVLDGITTNPSLLAKEGKIGFEAHVREICNLVDGPVSVEVTSTNFSGILKEGREIASWAENIVIKVPMTPDGLRAVSELRYDGIDTNVTLCFSPNQALLAAKAGARFVSPFIGRLDENGQDGMILIAEMVKIFQNYHFNTEILVASVRHPRHVTEAAKLGADAATIPFDSFKKLIGHPLTDSGLEKFLSDWKNAKIK